MTERLLARLLFAAGMIPLSLLAAFGPSWGDASLVGRAGFVLSVAAAVAGLALDVKHRREDRAASDGSS